MGKIIDFLSRKSARSSKEQDPILGLLAEEIERSARLKLKQQDDQPPITTWAATWLKRLTIAGLLASTLPHLPISAGGAWIAVLTLIAFYILRHTHRPPVRRHGFTTAALVAVSLLTGCAPLLHENSNQAEIIQFCQTRILDGEACKYGGGYGVRILGIRVKGVDTEQIARSAGITRAVGLQEIRGHGLIAVDQVVVYGS